jgi:UDP-N-acetylglucosamine 4,6-dehydratase
MCPSDDSHLTLELDDHFVICPTITFTRQVDFRCNRLGEVGQPVVGGAEYQSGSNPHFLTIEQIAAVNRAEGFA